MGTADLIVDDLVKQVMAKLGDGASSAFIGMFEEMDDAVEACWLAQKELIKLSLDDRQKLIYAIKKVAWDYAGEFAEMAVEETKMGNYEHKFLKNRLVADKTPGVEDLKAEAMSGDNGLTLLELSPFGVIGAITPTTNPTETVLCNAIGMIAAGNGVVFSPHPTAKRTTLRCISLVNEAIIAAGGPRNIITTVASPTIDQVNKMIKHPKINMLVATGGPAVVKTVLSSGKKAIGAGAGNPPAVVDETADIEKAAKDIVDGCSFDNNLPCVAEKEVIVVDRVADYLIFHMQANGAHLITDPKEQERLVNLLIVNDDVNRGFIGRSAAYILDKLGIAHKDDVRVIILEAPLDHPFVQHELMMPVLGIVRVADVDEAIEAAVQVEHGYRHTAIMHSKNIDNLSRLAKKIQTTIFVKNGPSYAGIGVGGEGHTTFTIAGPTGEGLTSAKTFTRKRRCVLVDGFNIK